MKTLLIAAALAVTVPQQGSGRPDAPPTDAQFAAVRGALDERLLDYPSARFRDVRGTDLVICGFVNSKNRMGAYVGWNRFAWASFADEPYLLIDSAESDDDIMLDAFCGEDGRKWSGPDFSDRVRHR
jgi:hypothetical protein